MAGNAGADGTCAVAGARSPSANGYDSGAGPGSADTNDFSAALADAAQAGDQTASAQVQDSKLAADGAAAGGKRNGGGASDGAGRVRADLNLSAGKADAPAGVRDAAASDANRTASIAAVATGHDLSANLLPGESQAAAYPTAPAPDRIGNVRDGRPAATPGAARTSGRDTASAVTTDPVALAMLLAASGMQMNGGAGASAATDGTGSAAGNTGSSREPVIAASGAAAQSTPMTQSAAARDTPPMAADAATFALTAHTAPDAAAAAPGRGANPDGPAGQPTVATTAAGLPDLMRSFTATGTQAAAAEATISVPVGSGGWPQAVAAQVHWFVSNDVQSATLHLSPEHLGPVEVHIDVQQSQVNVNFSAAHAETRAALEQTVPRLREIFASGGLTLGHTNVQQDPRPGSQPTTAPVRAAFAHPQTVEPVAITAPHTLGLVDEYA
ncbi:MAG: flagellar hook-length control protein FliK [Steroidobacterales bacterium]